MDCFIIKEEPKKIVLSKKNTLRDRICQLVLKRALGYIELHLTYPGTVWGGGKGQGDDVYFVSDTYKFRKYDGHEEYLENIKITARDLLSYPSEVQEILDKDIQYLEVGAGIGEPIYIMASSKIRPKPTAIDPVNYKLLEQMLLFARDELIERLPSENSKNIVRTNKLRINTLIERCRIIQDPQKVTLYNMTLNRASRFRSLQGIADIVVDFFGPKFNSDKYDFREQSSIDESEKRFLKPNGRLLQYK